MSEIIDVSQKHQDIFYTFLDDAKVFFDSDQGHKYPYTGITRLDGKAGLGYVNKDIENGAYKESFAFNLRNDEVPFKVEKVVEAFQEIGFDYLRGIDEHFCEMHDDQPLIRIHKYNTDFEYLSKDDEKLRFFPHRDYGTITLLYQFDDVKGLQYKTFKTEWVDFDFDPNKILVLYGVVMEDFGYDGTYHRLINNDKRVRYSMSAHFDLKQKYLGDLTIKERLGIKER